MIAEFESHIQSPINEDSWKITKWLINQSNETKLSASFMAEESKS